MVALRVHHSIGDGMSLVAVGRSVLESATGGEVGLGGAGVGAALTASVKSAKRALSNFTAGQVSAEKECRRNNWGQWHARGRGG